MYAAEDLIGPDEAARLLGVGPTRLAQLVREGRLVPVLELPTGRVYDRRTVQRYAAERAEQAKRDARVRVPAIPA